jgi:hypothetical protein
MLEASWWQEDEWRWLDIILDVATSWQNWLEFQHYNSYVPTSSRYVHTAESLYSTSSVKNHLIVRLKLKSRRLLWGSAVLLRGFGPLENYADRATAASWRSSTNFCGLRVLRGQRNGSPRSYSRFSW